MKIQNITNGLIAALVFSSPIVGAEEYPAANFEPKVLYSDSDYKHSESSSVATSSKKAETSKADPKYPAANFQPEVLYQDTNYKHNQGSTASASKSTSTVSSSSSSEASSEAPATAEKADDSMTTILGLVVLAVVGFVFFNKKSAPASGTSSQAPVRRRPAPSVSAGTNNTGLTGVARYLNKNMPPEMSSVAKYLESKEKNPKTGVSKYVARKVVAVKAAAAAKTTGVEKYLRNRG